MAAQITVGQDAPDFTLPYMDREGSFQLSSARGMRPVVAIFGSFT